MFRQFQINRQNSILAYKILHDSLLVLLIFFVLALIAEGLLPEIIATHFALYKIALLILGNVLAITGLQKVTSIHEENKINKKIAGSLFFILALLIFNSLFKNLDRRLIGFFFYNTKGIVQYCFCNTFFTFSH